MSIKNPSTLFSVGQTEGGKWKVTTRTGNGRADHTYFKTEFEAWSFVVGYAESARTRARTLHNLRVDREIETHLDWLTWAKENGIHPMVIDFMKRED